MKHGIGVELQVDQKILFNSVMLRGGSTLSSWAKNDAKELVGLSIGEAKS